MQEEDPGQYVYGIQRQDGSVLHLCTDKNESLPHRPRNDLSSRADSACVPL